MLHHVLLNLLCRLRSSSLVRWDFRNSKAEHLYVHRMLYEMALRIAKLCLLVQIIQPHAKPKLCQRAIFNANSVPCHLISAKQFCSLEREVHTAALLKSALNKSLIQLLLELVTENSFMAHAAPHLELMNCCQEGMSNDGLHTEHLIALPVQDWCPGPQLLEDTSDGLSHSLLSLFELLKTL